MGAIKVNGALATATGKRYFLPGQFFESRGKHPFVAEDKRTIPVDVLYARMETDQVSYRLPPGLNVESAPQAADASWPDHALLKIASVAREDSVVVARTLAYNFTVLDPNDYAGLHDFYQKVATADQQQLVLTHAAVAAKGN
jgi:hypothetical protein